VSGREGTADLLRRPAEYPNQVGVDARYTDVHGYLHVSDPQTGAWRLLPVGDLPTWVRCEARRPRAAGVARATEGAPGATEGRETG
jgi:hypothetical protein